MIFAAGQYLPYGRLGAVDALDGIDYPARLRNKNQVAVLRHYFGIERKGYPVPKLVRGRKIYRKHTVKPVLAHIGYLRARQVLSHEHTEHRRHSRILRRTGGQVHARAVCGRGKKELLRAVSVTQMHNQLILRGLMHLFDTAADNIAAKLPC